MNKLRHALPLLIIVFFGASIATVSAAPISVPTLLMTRGYVNITVKLTSANEVEVLVESVYSFENVTHDVVKMYYPIPPNASDVKIYVNDERVKWSYDTIIYGTVLGNYPTVYWEIENPLRSFNVTITYSYKVLKENEYFKILYATGTGKYLEAYVEPYVIYVNLTFIDIPLNSEVYVGTASLPEERVSEKLGLPVPYNYVTWFKVEKEPFSMGLSIASFKPSLNDLLILIKPTEFQEKYEWKKYIPSMDSVEINTKGYSNGTALVTVKITFRHGGFKVERKEPIISDDIIILPVDFYKWTGPSIQVITTKELNYKFTLNPGEYIVRLVAFNNVVTEEKLIVPSRIIEQTTIGTTRLTLFGLTVLIVLLSISTLLFTRKHE